ncbi:MAG TPA: hypothetical protein VFV56_05895 [Gaiellaceae bacterium]|nr:hypothetical protein [Gaiellaceae bacterium]
MSRTRAWIVVFPVITAGVVVAHALAYRLTATPTEPLHAYLGHAPQVLLLLVLSGFVLGGLGRSRAGAPAAHVFPLVAVTTFAVQEHLERLVHGGSVPILVSSPAFLLGIALQVPFALLAWLLARWLLSAAEELLVSSIAFRPRFDTPLVVAPTAAPAAAHGAPHRGRGPPTLLRPR